jgi:hypothetical protein
MGLSATTLIPTSLLLFFFFFSFFCYFISMCLFFFSRAFWIAHILARTMGMTSSERVMDRRHMEE